ncbi:MAG TPA: hypothetical protein VF650_13590 [Allosphingosinicella sp.]|jgi:hypothetical protein
MRNAIIIVLAMAVAGCARSQIPNLREVHAPPGWESFCFPVYFEFVGETHIVSDKSRELLRVMEGTLDYRSFRWFHLEVGSGGSGARPAPRALIRRRTEALLRLLPEVGIAVDRVEVSLSPKLSAFDRNPANLTVMIPPEQVEANRVAFETNRTVMC